MKYLIHNFSLRPLDQGHEKNRFPSFLSYIFGPNLNKMGLAICEKNDNKNLI